LQEIIVADYFVYKL